MAEISGNIVRFNAVDAPLASLKVNIEAVQDTSGGVPSPTNICPISGFTGTAVTITGKNLIPYPYHHTTRTSNGITWTDNGDGTITANGTATANSEFVVRNRTNGYKLPAGNYMLSGCPSGGSSTTYAIWFAQRTADDSAWINNNYDIGSGLAVTISNPDLVIHITLNVRSGQTVSNMVFKPMLRFSSETDDSWNSAMYNTDYSVDWTDVVGTVYGGTMDFGTGVLTLTHRCIVLDGSETWGALGVGYRMSLGNFKGVSYDNDTDKANWLYAANTNPTSASVAVPNTFVCGTYLNVNVPEVSSVDELKTLLASRNLQIVYELATPITYKLNIDEAESVPGINYVWSDMGNVDVEYSEYHDFPQVLFGKTLSFNDLKLYYDESSSSTESPEPRKVLVDIPFRNGKLNATKALTDKIFYENRSKTLSFKGSYFDITSWESFCTKILNSIHGREFKMVVYTDPDYYWEVYNANVESIDSDDGVASVGIECDCYPYKLKRKLTTQTVNVTTTGVVKEFVNGRMEVNPTFTTDASVQVQWTNKLGSLVSVTIPSGTTTCDEIEFYEGLNTLTFNKLSSNATVKVSYREGDL